MASNKGYTTATKVKDVLAGKVAGYFTDAMIESAINRVEGVIDSVLKHGSDTGGYSFTWATAKSSHWVVEGAATYGAALQVINASIASYNSLDDLVAAQNGCAYMFKLFMDIIKDEEYGDHINAQ